VGQFAQGPVIGADHVIDFLTDIDAGLAENLCLRPFAIGGKGDLHILDTGKSFELRRDVDRDYERDRRAILAMAGPYRVTFDFLEVVRFDPSLKPDAPYQSWGTEYVFVSEDRKDFIALQHILVQRVRMEDGTLRTVRESTAPAVGEKVRVESDGLHERT